MKRSFVRRHIDTLLERADVCVNGQRPWDIKVRNENLYRRVLSRGSLGFGEAYMDGWWETESLDQMIARLVKARLDEQFKSTVVGVSDLKAKIFNCQSVRRAFQVGKHHYDVGNDLYRRMLDERMIYSCGYWKKAESLDQSQLDKLDLTCRKLHLEPGHKVLDIGCGWGGTARYMAEHYGVEVVGVTVSQAQADYAQVACRGYPITILVQDYRSLCGVFDRVVSIGMFEHVGYKNYRTYFKKVKSLLKDDGLFLLHTIGRNRATHRTDPWIDKYIFPNGMIPSTKQLSDAFEGLFVLEDWHNFGVDYDKTLMAWRDNFESSWPELKQFYDERFKRMWTYYLLASAGCFRARENQLWQIVLSKKGVPDGFHFPR